MEWGRESRLAKEWADGLGVEVGTGVAVMADVAVGSRVGVEVGSGPPAAQAAPTVAKRATIPRITYRFSSISLASNDDLVISTR